MNDIYDLRSALEVLKATPGQLVETDVEADPNAEISGIYRYVGAGGTVPRPTKEDGPAMLFNYVKGFPGAKVITAVLASRKRVGLLLGADYKRLGWHLRDAVKKLTGRDVAVFVSDGEPPAGPVRETGGLANLRALIERQGGQMEIESAPVFRLVLRLKKEGKLIYGMEEL